MKSGRTPLKQVLSDPAPKMTLLSSTREQKLRRACSSAPRMTPHRALQYTRFWQPSGSSTKSVSGLSSRICSRSTRERK